MNGQASERTLCSLQSTSENYSLTYSLQSPKQQHRKLLVSPELPAKIILNILSPELTSENYHTTTTVAVPLLTIATKTISISLLQPPPYINSNPVRSSAPFRQLTQEAMSAAPKSKASAKNAKNAAPPVDECFLTPKSFKNKDWMVDQATRAAKCQICEEQVGPQRPGQRRSRSGVNRRNTGTQTHYQFVLCPDSSSHGGGRGVRAEHKLAPS